jgi:hypothetical protein
MNATHAAKCRAGNKQARDRKAADVLTSSEIDRIVLDAIHDDAGNYDSIQLRLTVARLAAINDALAFDDNGRLIRWAY